MTPLVLYYILGALIVSGIQTVWFCSNLPVHIFKLLRLIKEEDDVYSWDEWQVWLTTRSSFFGELLSCTVCLSVWLSVIVSLTQTYLLELPQVWYIVSAALSWPAIAYTIYKFNRNE